ncbi:flavodoxin [Campylobacter blaseri]|uniref:Flavodoxin n=2 Tax=Campylobacter blaseri TaxID=2042961 RepID=A0A2P8R492_9BACT|nr:flavodoxin [Campylobacter blaseri]PSM54785.1 flavodoxin [Campylobacter blaseri]
MKNVVIYSSKTGNTKKVAEAIAQSLDYELINIDDVRDFDDYEKIIFGFWVDKGFMDTKTKKKAENIKNKTLGIFFTSGVEPNSEHAKECLEKSKEYFTILGNNVTHLFCCQGAIDPEVIEIMKNMAIKMGDKAVHKITDERRARWKKAETHPDKEDLKNAILAFSNF